MRTSNINVRVEPEVSRGLTWATNKYNFENCEKFTKTDVIELLVKAIMIDSDVLKLCNYLTLGLDLEKAAKTAKGRNFEPIMSAKSEDIMQTISSYILDEIGANAHRVSVRRPAPTKLTQGYHIEIDGEYKYFITDAQYKADGLNAALQIASIFKCDFKRKQEDS